MLLGAVASAFLLLASSIAGTAAADLRGHIQPNEFLAELLSLGPDAKAILRRIPDEADSLDFKSGAVAAAAGGDTTGAAPEAPSATTTFDKYMTYITPTGLFAFTDVQSGAYTLDFQTRWFSFHQYRVDVAEEDEVRADSLSKPVKVRVHPP